MKSPRVWGWRSSRRKIRNSREHWGFDVAAIEKALAHNERHENRVRGASTLSQQTVKNLFLVGMVEAGCEKVWKRA